MPVETRATAAAAAAQVPEEDATPQALWAAAREGNVAAVETLLSTGQTGSQGAGSAVASNTARELMAAGDEQDMTALMHAADHGHVDAMHLLLHHPSAQQPPWGCALRMATPPSCWLLRTAMWMPCVCCSTIRRPRSYDCTPQSGGRVCAHGGC